MKKKNRLLELERHIRRNPKKQLRARSKAFDDGQPIRLQYSPDYYGTRGTRRPAPPWEMSLAAERVPYSVKAFEEETQAKSQPETLGGADLEAVEQDSAREQEQEREREREREREEEREQERERERERETAEEASARRWAPDALAFEERLRQTTEARQKAEAMGAPPEEPESTASRHDIFDKMGRNMAYAKTFDLGDVSVRRLFDEFDEKLAAKPAGAQMLSDLEIAQDLELMSREAQVPAIHVVYTDVPLIPQQTGMSCWAAGAAMLVAWRDRMSVDPSEIARAAGAWAQYQKGLALEDDSIFPVWGLVPEPPQTYTIQGFANLLQRYGPLWVANAVPGPHIRVVTGLSGDGTPDGTIVYINDPWERGMTTFRLPNAGARYTETYRQFEATQAALARQESAVNGIYVARLNEPRR